jgi:hypothetical protein
MYRRPGHEFRSSISSFLYRSAQGEPLSFPEGRYPTQLPRSRVSRFHLNQAPLGKAADSADRDKRTIDSWASLRDTLAPSSISDEARQDHENYMARAQKAHETNMKKALDHWIMASLDPGAFVQLAINAAGGRRWMLASCGC